MYAYIQDYDSTVQSQTQQEVQGKQAQGKVNKNLFRALKDKSPECPPNLITSYLELMNLQHGSLYEQAYKSKVIEEFSKWLQKNSQSTEQHLKFHKEGKKCVQPEFKWIDSVLMNTLQHKEQMKQDIDKNEEEHVPEDSEKTIQANYHFSFFSVLFPMLLGGSPFGS